MSGTFRDVLKWQDVSKRSTDCIAGFLLALSRTEREYSNSLENAVKGFFKVQNPSFFDEDNWKLMLALTDAVRIKAVGHKDIAYKICNKNGLVGNIKRWIGEQIIPQKEDDEKKEEFLKSQSLKLTELEQYKQKLFDSSCREVGRLLHINKKIEEKLRIHLRGKKKEKKAETELAIKGSPIQKKTATGVRKSKIPVRVVTKKPDVIPPVSKSAPNQLGDSQKQHIKPNRSLTDAAKPKGFFGNAVVSTLPPERVPAYKLKKRAPKKTPEKQTITPEKPTITPEKPTIRKKAIKKQPNPDLDPDLRLSLSISSGSDGYFPCTSDSSFSGLDCIPMESPRNPLTKDTVSENTISELVCQLDKLSITPEPPKSSEILVSGKDGLTSEPLSEMVCQKRELPRIYELPELEENSGAPISEMVCQKRELCKIPGSTEDSGAPISEMVIKKRDLPEIPEIPEIPDLEENSENSISEILCEVSELSKMPELSKTPDIPVLSNNLVENSITEIVCEMKELSKTHDLPVSGDKITEKVIPGTFYAEKLSTSKCDKEKYAEKVIPEVFCAEKITTSKPNEEKYEEKVIPEPFCAKKPSTSKSNKEKYEEKVIPEAFCAEKASSSKLDKKKKKGKVIPEAFGVEKPSTSKPDKDKNREKDIREIFCVKKACTSRPNKEKYKEKIISEAVSTEEPSTFQLDQQKYKEKVIPEAVCAEEPSTSHLNQEMYKENVYVYAKEKNKAVAKNELSFKKGQKIKLQSIFQDVGYGWCRKFPYVKKSYGGFLLSKVEFR